MKLPNNCHLVYYWCDSFNSFVITTIELIKKQESIHHAFNNLETWKELETKIDNNSYIFLYKLYCEIHEIDIDKRSKIDWDTFNEIYPHDFPVPLIYKMEDIISTDILKKYGKEIITLHDGSYYEITNNKINKIVDELKLSGYSISPYYEEQNVQ